MYLENCIRKINSQIEIKTSEVIVILKSNKNFKLTISKENEVKKYLKLPTLVTLYKCR